jgi:hypothetical protein
MVKKLKIQSYARRKMKKNSPLQAIRLRCLDCCGYFSSKVKNCPISGCPLYKYRFCKKDTTAKLSVLKSIRKFCLECQGDSPKGVQECTDPNCALYPFRFGKNPNFEISNEQRKILIQRLKNTPTHIQARKKVQSHSEIKNDAVNRKYYEKQCNNKHTYD